MIELIPGVIEHDWKVVEQKAKNFENLVDWVHIDVSDGKFTPNKIWNNPQDLENIETSLNIEVHLMIERPWEVIDEWLKTKAKRFIFHFESLRGGGLSNEEIKELFKKVKDSGKEAILAFNISTPWQDGKEAIPFTNGVLLMPITPGYSGQEFQGEVFEKISSLSEEFPSLIIEIDGGVKPGLVEKLVSAGANRFVSTSYIQEGDINERIGEYKKVISQIKKSDGERGEN